MNLIGESFDDFVGTQVNLRQKFYGSSTTVLEGREQYLYNKQPFIKLVSSVNIEAAKLKKLGLPESLAGSGLAKSFVLFALFIPSFNSPNAFFFALTSEIQTTGL